MEANPEQIAVMLVSRRRAMLDVLSPRLATEPGLRLVCAPVDDPARWFELLAAESPDVLMLDDALVDVMPIRRHHQRRPGMRVLLWCDQPSEIILTKILIQRCHGFILTRDPPATVLKALHAVRRGELWLPRVMLADAIRKGTPARAGDDAVVDAALIEALGVLTHREAEVVERLRHGYTNKEIGRQLGIMEDTVKKHLQSVFTKLGVHRRGLVMLRQAPDSLDGR